MSTFVILIWLGWILAVFCGAALVCFWSWEKIRDSVLDALEGTLERFGVSRFTWESHLKTFVTVALIALIIAGASVSYWTSLFTPMATATTPRPPVLGPPPPATTIQVSGRVVSRATDDPIVGCQLAASGTDSQTAKDGSFSLTLPAELADATQVTFNHPAYQTVSISLGKLRTSLGHPVELSPRDPVPLPPRFTVTAKVVSTKDRKPLPDCQATLEQATASSAADGLFTLRLASKPSDEALLNLTHEDHLPRLLRFGDLRLNGDRPIELAPKMRFLVVEFVDAERDKARDPFRLAVRACMSERLAGFREVGLLPDDKRDQVVAQLEKYQEGRALYDQKTLAKVGGFLGATHGVFGTVKSGIPRGISLECSLIDLRSGEALASASTSVESDQQVAAAKDLVDQLLARLSTVTILFPQDGGTVPRKITVQGHILYFPESWSLWISVLPLGNAKHFPQLRLTRKADGSWLASDVQIGPDALLAAPASFEVYAVLASPEGSKAIQEYHDRIELDPSSNNGLPLNAWKQSKCRLLGSIRVVRDDGKFNASQPKLGESSNRP